MRQFRRIIVNDITYWWLFRFDDYDYQNYPYLLIVMDSHPHATLKLVFSIHDHFLLNEGLPASLQGNAVSINLNRPLFVSQLIVQCRKNGETFEQQGYKRLDGVQLLTQIGYTISPLFLGI